MSRRILATGVGGSGGINFTKSLRMDRRRFYIVGGDINRWHLEPPDVDARYEVPRASDPSYIAALKKIIRREDVGLVHPQPDVEVEIISASREMLGARTLLPSKEAIRICRDKMATNRTLRAVGVPVPESHLVERTADISRILKRPRRSEHPVWLRAVRGAGSRAALPVGTVRQAREWIHEWRTMRALESRDFMMAEFLPGEEYAFQSLRKAGKYLRRLPESVSST